LETRAFPGGCRPPGPQRDGAADVVGSAEHHGRRTGLLAFGKMAGVAIPSGRGRGKTISAGSVARWFWLGHPASELGSRAGSELCPLHQYAAWCRRGIGHGCISPRIEPLLRDRKQQPNPHRQCCAQTPTRYPWRLTRPGCPQTRNGLPHNLRRAGWSRPGARPSGTALRKWWYPAPCSIQSCGPRTGYRLGSRKLPWMRIRTRQLRRSSRSRVSSAKKGAVVSCGTLRRVGIGANPSNKGPDPSHGKRITSET